MSGALRIAYVVSRFPQVSETFVVRELNAVERCGAELELLALFPPSEPVVHASARAWIRRVQRPGPWAGARALLWWARRRPRRLASSVASIARGHARHPRILLRALATVPLAAAHARALHERPVDHVHAHFATYPALAAWLCHRLTGVPYSFTAHAHDLFVHQCFLAEKVADSSFVVTISAFNRRFLERFSDGTTPVHVVHCGVDAAGYPFRERAGGGEGPVTALCVATLQEKKGHPVLLRALAAPVPEAERLHLELVGGGPLREHLERLAGDLGVRDRVTFRGSVREEQVRGLLDRADVFVLPSIRAPDGQMEGIPVALMEALAAGVPVVATRLSGVPELVEDGVTGVLAEPGDPESLGRALGRLLADPAGAARMARAGRARVEAEFDVEASARRLVGLFAGSAVR